jgi:TonB-linked SusC/RagA family outer membrane protein
MRLKVKLLGLMFFLGGFLNYIIAQNITITGKVKNKATGDALVGATVNIDKTTKSTQTDGSGNFSISAVKGNTLVISFSGMSTTKYVVSKLQNITIELDENPNKLDEVVVIGYGKMKFSKISGAVSTVKSDLIEKLKPVRTEEALQGTVSGVTVIQSGSPGSKPTIFLRGIASYGGNAPLVVVDGSPQTQDDLNSLNPAEIESISVLKDAALTAIYGVGGGNGVILVTTKNGKKNQKVEYNINSNYGIQEVINTIGVLNASEYAGMINEGSTLSGGNIIFPDLSKVGAGTNWQKQVFKTASSQSHTITAKGGNENVTYFLSGGYNSQGGIVGGDDKSFFKRGNLTANLTFDLSSKLKLLLNTSAVILGSKTVQENSFNSILGSAINYDPTVSVYNNVPNTVGQYGFSNLLLSEIYNPLTKLENTYNQNNGFKLYGKIELQYDILKNLKATTRFGYQKYDDNSKSFDPLVFWGLNNTGNSLDPDGSTKAGYHNSVSSNKNSNFNYTAEAFLNYSFKVKEDHNFEVVGGVSLQKTSGNAAGASRQDVPYNSWTFADITAATGTNNSTNSNAQTGYYYEYFNRKSSVFGRMNYDYKDKYLVSFNGRNDGSTVFGKNNKFGFFSSGSIGWVVSKEAFFKSKVIDLLKLRASSGSTGNDNTIQAFYVSIVTGGSSYGPTGNSNGYTFGDVFYPGSTVANLRNDNVKWESNQQTNIGFDLSILKNKFAITFDYYSKGAEGLLFNTSVSPYVTGTLPNPPANVGTTKTTGIDLQLTYNETIARKIKLNTSLTFTTIKNEVTSTNADGTAKIIEGYYFNGQSQNVTRFEQGKAPGYFYGFKTDGLFQNQAQIAASPTQNIGTAPGDIKFVDVNKDGKITEEDRTDIGNPFPNFIMGWNLNINYKNIDFTAFTYASIGNDVFRAYERNANYTNKDRSILARWTGEGTTNNAKNPHYTFDDKNSNIRVSDRYVEDGSFIRVKNIQLGYTFPASFAKKVFSKLRVYAQVRNAFTFTKYAGLDPEISGGVLNTGIDRGAYPQPRTYAIGIDIKF